MNNKAAVSRSTSSSRVRPNATQPPNATSSKSRVIPATSSVLSNRSASAPKKVPFGSSTSTRRTTDTPTTSVGSRSNNSSPNLSTSKRETTVSASETTNKRLSMTRLNPHKASNPFSSKNNNFGVVYDSGEIPCRIYHTGNKMLIQWDAHPDELPYNPIIIAFAEGLRETQHPYVFLARQGLKELLGSSGARALMSPEADIFEAGLEATEALCSCLESDLPQSILDRLLVPVARKCFDKKYGQKIHRVLQSIEQSCMGNEEIARLIRKKVPSYSNAPHLLHQ